MCFPMKVAWFSFHNKRLLAMLVVIVVFLMLFFKLLFCKKSDSVQAFLDRSYTTFNGGAEASVFFDDYIDISDYNSITFKYIDNESAITLHKSYTVFCVDIEYEKIHYQNITDDILPYTNYFDVESQYQQYGSFLLTTIMEKKPIYENNYCGVFWDNERNIVRYLFLYRANRENVLENGEISTICRSIDLPWYV